MTVYLNVHLCGSVYVLCYLLLCDCHFALTKILVKKNVYIVSNINLSYNMFTSIFISHCTTDFKLAGRGL